MNRDEERNTGKAVLAVILGGYREGLGPLSTCFARMRTSAHPLAPTTKSVRAHACNSRVEEAKAGGSGGSLGPSEEWKIRIKLLLLKIKMRRF